MNADRQPFFNGASASGGQLRRKYIIGLRVGPSGKDLNGAGQGDGCDQQDHADHDQQFHQRKGPNCSFRVAHD